MLKIIALLSLTVLLAGGCAGISRQAMQDAVDRVDSAWSVANTDLKKTVGVRIYKLPKKRAFQAMLVALNELGFVIHNLSYESGFIVAKAPIPTPLSKSEWAAVKQVEEPRMRAIAASVVGPKGALLFRLHDNNFEIILNVVMLERARDLRISFGFQMVYTGPPRSVAYRQQPPPEAVKYAMVKAWDRFERIALVQSKTFQ